MGEVVKPKMSVKSNLPAVDAGSLIVTTDTGDAYVDVGQQRIKLSDVITGTYSEITNLITPLTNKIYFATDTYQLLQATYGGRNGSILQWKVLNGYTLPKATTSTVGGVMVDGATLSVTNTGLLSVPKASTTQQGSVKVDGTTININESGVISAAGGSGNAGTKRLGNAIVPSTEFTLDPGYVEGSSRGYGAVDLQMYRDDASHVISGGQSFGAGSNNTCIGSGCAVFGYGNTINGNTSAVFGMNNVAEGESTYIFGDKITQTREGDPIYGVYAGTGYSSDIGLAMIHNVVMNGNGETLLDSDEPVFGHTGFKGICIRKPRAYQSYEIIKVGAYTALVMEIQCIQYASKNSCYTGTYKCARQPLMDYLVTEGSGSVWGSPFYNGDIRYDNGKIVCMWMRDDWEFVQLGVRYTILGKGVEEPHNESGGYGSGYGYYGYGSGYGYYGNGYGYGS